MHYHLSDIQQISGQLADILKKYKTICFTGQLGAGKTTLVRHIGRYLGISEPLMSPTFAYVHRYRLPNGEKLYHFDLYRLTGYDQLVELGLQDLIEDPEALKIIEWPERLAGRISPQAVQIAIEQDNQDPERRVLHSVYPDGF